MPEVRGERGFVALWSCLIIGSSILLVIAASFSTRFGVEWSSGSPMASKIRGVEWRAGRLCWERLDLGVPGVAAIPLRFTSGTPTLRGAAAMGTSTVRLPVWLPLLPVAIPVVVLARLTYRANLRAKRGCCRVCGYDLKGLEPTDRVIVCPECGKAKRRRRIGPGGTLG